MAAFQSAFPRYDIDLFSDEVMADPYPHYAVLRNMGPVVALPAHDVLAVSRYADVKKILLDHRNFSSASGVAFNDVANEASRGTSLASDEPLHSKLRQISAAPLQPNALAELRAEIAQSAEELIVQLVERKNFDGVTDLAHHLPITIVSKLVGLPEEGRENMLEWAAAAFDSMGPFNDRFEALMAKAAEMFTYIAEQAGPHQVKPGSWAQRIYDAGAQGLITQKEAAALLMDYLGPSLDTTIFGTGHLLKLLADHPEQWKKLKADPSLVGNAVEEALRIEAPLRTFTRMTVAPTQVGGETIPSAARVAVFYAAANRDERHWPNAHMFDVTRENAKDHLSFGKGRHTCAGQHLAKLEMTCLLQSMVRHVETITAGEPVLARNSILRGYSSLPMTFS